MFPNKNPRVLALVAALGMMMPCLAGCSQPSADELNSAEEQEADEMEGEAVNIDADLVAGGTQFGIDLLKRSVDQERGQNVFISPSSVAMALAMTYNGAAGDTRKSMAQTLHLEGMTAEQVNKGFAELREALAKSDKEVELRVANSLWSRKGFVFKPAFLARNKEFFGAEATVLDFGSPSAPSTINSWVSEKTNGRIDQIIDSIPSDAILYLINAIYFKGKWTDKFDAAQTKPGPFTLPTGASKNVPMMSQSGEYRYLKGENFQAVSLPYGNRNFSMYIFLPDAGQRLDEFIAALTADTWEEWIEEFEKTPGDISLPRFKIEYETLLNEQLAALGMAIAFDSNRADFSEMIDTTERVFINRVKHKTFVEVNEEGTEAAGATSVEVTITSMPRPRERFKMVVDRPFLCAIRENRTGAVLFAGAIVDPK